jgi:hypothetical protein
MVADLALEVPEWLSGVPTCGMNEVCGIRGAAGAALNIVGFARGYGPGRAVHPGRASPAASGDLRIGDRSVRRGRWARQKAVGRPGGPGARHRR